MPFQFTDQSRAGVPIDYQFAYGGASTDWGTKKLMSMSNVSCKAVPLDGKFSVSEITCSFSDTDGSIWGSLGHGTVGLGSSWSATVFIGGTMGEQSYGPSATRLARLNTVGAGTYVIHKGRITELSRKNRTVTINSKSLMAQVEDLEWQFPVATNVQSGATSLTSWDSLIGSNFFFNRNISTTYGSAFFNLKDSNSGFDVYAFVGTFYAGDIRDNYPTVLGRGTLGVTSGFAFPGTQFYYDYDRFLFKGSYLGTYNGSITTSEEANTYGYLNTGDSEAAKTGGSYVINKTRLVISGAVGTLLFSRGSGFYWQQSAFNLSDTPANLWKELLTGCCVTSLFGTNDLETVGFATAQRNTAYQTFSQKIDPKGGKVLPYLKDLMSPLRALWSVNASDTFQLTTFGPRTYADVIGTISQSEIIDSEASIDLNSKFNRVTFDYGFSFETGSFNKRLELTGSGWGTSNDFPLILESKWLANDNDAKISVQRILSRFSRGVSKLNLTIPLTRLTADIGSLFAITDADLGYTTRVFEVVGWDKDFANNRTEILEMWDGDSMYQNRGYAKWEGDNSLTKAVSGTSLSGWGTNGTVNNINQAFFGSVFVWF